MSDSLKNITVLMPVYNDSEFLKCSVNSILNQTHKDFEFLIIDDGSQDNPEEIINSFGDSRINYKKITHTGIAGALNYGMKAAAGDWIARIDADDISILSRIEKQINFLKKNAAIDVVSGRSVYFEDPGKILFFINPPESDEDIKKMLSLHNPINHSSVMFNKKKVLSEGGYDERFKCYEDFELWFRLREKLTFCIIPEVLVYTRLRKNSLTKREAKNQIRELLFNNARRKEQSSKTDYEKLFWEKNLFWIEYFYGNKKMARNYFPKRFSIRESLAYLNTFLPDRIFTETIEFRFKHRIESKFRQKEKYRKELRTLLKSDQ